MGSKNDIALRGNSAPNRFTIFAFMWSIFVITETAKWGRWERSPSDLLMTMGAVWLFFRPWQVTPFVIVALAQLWNLGDAMPWVANHHLAAVLILLCILIELGRSAWINRGRPDSEAALERFAPPVRLLLITVYAWAFLHKLNTGFFDPHGSCAVAIYMKWVRMLPFLPTGEWARYSVIAGALLTEGAMAVLLVFRKTRPFGIVIAVALHLFLGIAAYFRFSAMADALLFLFLPAGAVSYLATRWRVSQLGQWVERGWNHPAVRWLYKWGPRVVVAGGLTVFLFRVNWCGLGDGGNFVYTVGRYKQSLLPLVVKTIWTFYSIGLLLIALWLLRVKALEWEPAKRFVRPVSLWGGGLVLLTVLTGAMPHLGLKTETSFAMFSNLRTEDGQTNHLVFRYSPVWPGYQRDLVEIISTSGDRRLDEIAGTGYRIPYFEFVSHMRREVTKGRVNRQVVYERNGQRVVVERAGDVPEFLEPDSYLLRKLLVFRGVAPADYTLCQH